MREDQGRGHQRIVFVACGKRKQQTKRPSLELYTGQYFRLCLALARSIVSDSHIYVLSAKYGVLSHEEVVEPYNAKLTDLSRSDLQQWRAEVKGFVLRKIQEGYKPVFICGDLYHQGLPGVKMLPKVAIGKQIQFIQSQLKPRGLFDV